jgi:protein SCO1
MNKTAILALMLAILMPAAGYLVVKRFSTTAVVMPRHYYEPDSIVTRTQRGKTVQDTVWHSVKNIQLINQLGAKVDLDSLHGKIVVMNFFFTRCPTICPQLTKNMKRLQDSFKKNDSIVQFVSVSIDPTHDSVHNLRKYADRYNVNHDTWWLVTGDKKEIYDFSLKEIKTNIADPGIDTGFIHSFHFYLLDNKRVVRGFYNGFDTTAMARLVRDIPLLMLEKDRTKPSFFRRFIPILPIIFTAIGIVFIVTILLNRRKNKNELRVQFNS